ncbi:MAG TPA: hypothetical protein VH479_22305 [Acidimicrobiales bacterium]
MPLGDDELWEEGRAGAPGPATAPGVIEATVLAEESAIVVADEPSPGVAGTGTGAYSASGLGSSEAGNRSDVAHVPLWGPPSGGRAVARWQQVPPAEGESEGSPSTAIEPVPLAPAGDERRRRTPAVIGVALAGALLLAGLAAVSAWPGTDTTGSLANQFGPGNPGPTDGDGRPVDLPPSQPATPVSFAPSGDVVRPEPRRARIIDPRSGEPVIVDLPPGTTVNNNGQVVVRVTGTPTSVSLPTTTTTSRPASTTTTTQGTTTTTEDTTTTSTTEEPTTTTEEPTTTVTDETTVP